MSDTIDIYDFEGFKEFLGVVEPTTEQVLKQAKKGMTEEERRMHGLDNHEYRFSVLTEKSMEGQGCNQIKYMLENSKTLSRNYWAAGLTIVRKCVDYEEGIEAISKDYEGYNYEGSTVQILRKYMAKFKPNRQIHLGQDYFWWREDQRVWYHLPRTF